MDELNKTNRLTIIVIAFVLVIVIGLITFRRPDVKYTLTPAESLALLNNSELTITPEQASTILRDSAGKTVFVDVRNSIAFGNGHVKNAINIPVRELFSSKNKALLRDIEKAGQTAVLYGETQQQANGPWLMLRQTGFKNVLLFTGTFAQIDVAHSDSLTKLLPQLTETPRIDTAALKMVSSPTSTENKTEKASPIRKAIIPAKRKVTSGGGC